MSFLSKLLKRKSYDDLPDLKELTKPLPQIPEISKTPQKIEEPTGQNMQMDIVRAKIDLILAELDNLKAQNQITNDRLRNLEKMLSESGRIKYY